ncbi:uncharacterized protein LOC130824765 [Amaranthus tricolor]|uniref:uncharacterized protein LOC130824765 n=1 Tax=Amaranthus tricolor TaxID=29722 RepID=UPI002585B821|nr:uncharacterized protein LOC130824765 [Amaranthus tricolor]
MSKVVSKYSVFSSTISHHHNDRNKSRNFPMKFSVSVGKRGKLVELVLIEKIPPNCFPSFIDYVTVVKLDFTLFGGGFSYTLGLSIGKSQEKELQPNMKEITSAEDLVDSLLKAGDQLVVVDVKAARLFILRFLGCIGDLDVG